MAAELQTIISLVERNMHRVQSALGDDQSFARRYFDLTDQTGNVSVENSRLAEQILALVAEYPAAQSILCETDPSVFPPLEPPSPTRAVSTGDPLDGPAVPPQGAPPAPEPIPSEPMENPMPASADPNKPARSARKPWTVEQWILIIKESITALLALLVVIFTLVIALQAFSYAGTQEKMSDAKDILLLMLGVAGVVIGYYFGRVPADARANQAQEQARDATAQAQEIKSEAESLASDMESMLTTQPSFSADGNVQRGAGGTSFSAPGGAAQPALNQEEWRKMRERVRRLQSMSREKL